MTTQRISSRGAWRAIRAPITDPTEKNWKEFIAHNPAVKIDDINFFKTHAVISEVENGLEYLKVMDLKTRRAAARIATPENVYTMSMGANPEFDTPIIRYNYASMITYQNLVLSFFLVLVIIIFSSYIGIKKVTKIDPFEIFRG